MQQLMENTPGFVLLDPCFMILLVNSKSFKVRSVNVTSIRCNFHRLKLHEVQGPGWVM